MRKALIFLGILNDSDVEWMIRAGKKWLVPAGTVLIHENQPMDSLFIVLEGEFLVYYGTARVTEVTRLKVGELLGEISFVDSRPPSTSVKATVNSAVLSIDRSELVLRLDEDIAFAARFYRAIAVFLADRLRTTTSQLGYGDELQLDENIEDRDEVPAHMLDTMSLAGTRFEELQKRLSGASLQSL